MKAEVIIRGKWDRIRFTLMFEALLIALLAPVLAWILERDSLDIGLMAVILSLKAMVLNFIYNYGFDRMDVRHGRVPTKRSLKGRMLHALGFELILMITSLPIVMWWLGLSLWQALVMDMALMGVVVLYTMAFTRVYDEVFPISQPDPLSYISLEVKD
mgnify:CR=1 FL=1|tara:strand:+ start:1173 stop:1646 length:474 start_codon:yes stop_codon:yes gene_type:complete